MDVFDLSAKITLDTNGFTSALDGIKKGLAGAGKIAAGMYGTVSAAAGKFAFDSIQAGMTFDQSMSQVAATLGVSVDEVSELSDYAKEMGRTTAFTATQSAEALNYMALAGYDAVDSMAMLPNVMNLASAGALDLGYASDVVTDAQTALGLKIEDMSGFVNQLAKTASTTNTSVGQLGEAILTIGGTAQFMSGGTEELNTVLGLLADNGIKGSEAGTHLRNMLLKLSAPTKEGADMIKDLGLEIFDAQGKMRSFEDIFGDLNTAMADFTEQQKIEVFSELFNTRDVAAATALLNTTSERWDKVSTAIENAGDAAGEMSRTQLNNLAGDVTLFKSALEGAQLALSDELNPSLREFVKFGTASITSLTNAFEEGGVEGVIDQLAPLLAEGMSVIAGYVPDVISLSTRFIGAFSTSILSKVPELVDTGLSMMDKFGESIRDGMPDFLSDALPKVLEFTSGLREKTGDVVDVGINFVSNLLQGLSEGMPEFETYIPEILNNIVGLITDNVPIILEAGGQLITSLGEGMIEGVPTFLETVLPQIMSFTTSLREGAGNIVEVGLQFLINLAQGIANGMPELLTYVPTIVSNIAGIINDNMPKILAAGIQIIMILASGVINAVPTLIQEFPKIVMAIWDVITAVNWVSLGSNLIKWIANGVKNLGTTVPNLLREIGTRAANFIRNINWAGAGQSIINFLSTGIRGMITQIPNLLLQIGRNALNLVRTLNWADLGRSVINFIVMGLRSLISNIPNVLKSIGNSALTALKNIDWWGVGWGMIQGIIRGITAGASSIITAAQNAAKSALSAAKRFLGIASPSKVFRDQVGKMMALGMGEGFEDNIPIDAMRSGVEDAIDGMSNLGSPAFGLGDEAFAKRNGFFATFNIYTDPAQDKESIAREVQDKFLTWYEQEAAIA